VNNQAVKYLKQRGIAVGLLGAALRDLPAREEYARSTPPVGRAEVKAAGFWYRTLAALLDLVILLLPVTLLSPLLQGPLGNLFGLIEEKIIPDYRDLLIILSWLGCHVALFLLLYLPYTIIIESSPIRATVGKLALGLRVTRSGGEKAAASVLIVRNLAKIISIFSFFIGFLMVGWTKQKQALHDKIAGTMICHSAGSESPLTPIRILALTTCAIFLLLTGSGLVLMREDRAITHVRQLTLGEITGPFLSTDDLNNLSYAAGHGSVFEEAMNRVNAVPLESALPILAKGDIEWQVSGLPLDDSYAKTHNIVSATFQTQDSHPCVLSFLAEKDGDTVLLREVRIGNEEMPSNEFYYKIKREFAHMIVAELRPEFIEQTRGLATESYRITSRLYAAESPQAFSDILSRQSSGSDSVEVWEEAINAGQAVSLAVDSIISVRDLLPSSEQPDICEIDIATDKGFTMVDRGGFGGAVKFDEAEIYFTSKAWLAEHSVRAE
jgi:uncharacterized RDD family membrane protein YckC